MMSADDNPAIPSMLRCNKNHAGHDVVPIVALKSAVYSTWHPVTKIERQGDSVLFECQGKTYRGWNHDLDRLEILIQACPVVFWAENAHYLRLSTHRNRKAGHNYLVNIDPTGERTECPAPDRLDCQSDRLIAVNPPE